MFLRINNTIVNLKMLRKVFADWRTEDNGYRVSIVCEDNAGDLTTVSSRVFENIDDARAYERNMIAMIKVYLNAKEAV